MKRNYDSSFFPPAPVLSVQFANSNMEFKSEPVRALVDTGADTTIVPISILEYLGLGIEAFGRVRGQWGDSRNVNMYNVNMYIATVIVEGIVFPGIVVVGNALNDETIIGRDVLNRMKITLDGLKEHIEIAGY